MKSFRYAILASFFPALIFGGSIKLASVFTDNMVLQQKKKIPIWGKAEEGEKITVEFNGQKATTQTKNQKWMVHLKPMNAGGPYTLRVYGGKDTVELKNVLIGEVWVASGQSNMEWPLSGAMNADQEIASAHYPQIRFFTVARATAPYPVDSVQGQWVECTPENAPSFSAVAYFFARELHLSEKCPIGIIHTSWGGTPAESWVDEASLKANPKLAYLLEPLEVFRKDPHQTRQEMAKKMAEWQTFWDNVFSKNLGKEQGWALPEYSLAEWTLVQVPQEGSILGKIDGVVWYRRDVEIPESWAGKDLVLKLGPIDDYDQTYFNGTEIGHIFRDTPNWWTTPRNYTIPKELVKPGRNTIAVRILDNWLGGGFTSDSAGLKIFPKDAPEQALSLSGKWYSRTEFVFDPALHPPRPEQSDESHTACVLYNAMIAPLIPYAIRGAIWYQGESNTSRAEEYQVLFPTLISSWRKNWKQGDFPFYFVQLANYMARAEFPTESEWAELREAQFLTLKVKNTGMAVAIDIGDATDIHPKNKQDVGKRLALWAEAKIFNRKVECSGPLYKSVQFKNGKAIVSFDHVDGGLEIKGGNELKGFAIAGKDGKFVWANAKIEKDKVIVWSPEVAEPIAVRYGWADNPLVNLYNKAGLPASPFRTDGKRK